MLVSNISNLRKLDSEAALERIKNVINRTPLQYAARLSEQYDASIYLKREDLQVVRSYKLRGAFNKISQLEEDQLKNGVVGASAGNHAQGLARSEERRVGKERRTEEEDRRT